MILGPVIDALYLDYTFHSNLTLHEQVDVGLVLLFPEKALIVVKDSLFRDLEQIFEARLVPGIERLEILTHYVQPVIVHLAQLIDVHLHVRTPCKHEELGVLRACDLDRGRCRCSFIQDWIAETLPRPVLVKKNHLA